MIVKPQPGPQRKFLESEADICIYGGAAGGGKTWSLLVDALRYTNYEGFGAVLFRQNANQIHNEGGLLDESLKLYGALHNSPAKLKLSPNPTWAFFNGKSKITFRHLERDSDTLKWQGSQIAMIGFDELTHFTRNQFFYMLSRNRSMCGIRPYIRATCNPDADSWVAEFIEWWIDQDTGYPIPERDGVIRYFIRRDDVLHWAGAKQELWDKFNLITRDEKMEIKSLSFISAKLEDNKVLMESNPGYLANLKALTLIDRERLLHGNWKIRPASGLYFKRIQIGHMLSILPANVKWYRAWDLAATDEEESTQAAFTAGILMGKTADGRYIVADVINERFSAADARQKILHTAQTDKAKFGNVRIRLPQDPGQAGKAQAQSFIKFLSGYNVVTMLESGSKETRAEPMAAQWQAGNFDVLIAPWNEMYFNQMEAFPIGKYKDMVDASSSAFDEIESHKIQSAWDW